MDVKAFHGMEVEELVARVHELKQELFHLRCQLALGRIENPMRIRQTRKNVARAKTVLREKQSIERSKNPLSV